MLYHVTFHTDRQALGSGETAQKVRTAEMERAAAAKQAGRLKGFWVRADGNGVVFVLDCESNEVLHAELSSLPIFPYLRSIEVMPIVAFPGI
jgi:muconolactone D-isomerase